MTSLLEISRHLSNEKRSINGCRLVLLGKFKKNLDADVSGRESAIYARKFYSILEQEMKKVVSLANKFPRSDLLPLNSGVTRLKNMNLT